MPREGVEQIQNRIQSYSSQIASLQQSLSNREKQLKDLVESNAPSRATSGIESDIKRLKSQIQQATEQKSQLSSTLADAEKYASNLQAIRDIQALVKSRYSGGLRGDSLRAQLVDVNNVSPLEQTLTPIEIKARMEVDNI